MSYYSKNDILDIISKQHEENAKNDIKPITPIEHVKNQIETNTDIVMYFWVDKQFKAGSFTFFRVDTDIYTDDRFAIDLYHASKRGKTVSDIIKERRHLTQEIEADKEGALKTIDELITYIKKKDGNK